MIHNSYCKGHMSKKVVGYFRTSSKSSVGEDKDSGKRQRHSVHTFCKTKGWDVVDDFWDKGVSGTLDVLNRPSFLEMLNYCEENEITTIVFENSSRMSRDLICMETGFQYLSSLGYTLISVDSPETFVDNTPTSVLIRQVLGCISQFEKSSLVSKLKVSRDRKSKLNKSRGYISRTGRGKVEGVKKMTELNSELSGLIVSYRRKKDIRTKKSLSYMKISKLLQDEHNLSVSFNSVKRILDDVKDEKRNKRNIERRKSSPILNVV